ncbi:hypothetical protein BRC2024_OFSGVTRC_CDS_0102 [Acinetobacter phage vB_AbaM_Rocket]
MYLHYFTIKNLTFEKVMVIYSHSSEKFTTSLSITNPRSNT